MLLLGFIESIFIVFSIDVLITGCLQVIAENLSEDEIAGLKEMFKMLDTDNSGQITLEELKIGLKRVGANLKDSEITTLMEAVIILTCFCPPVFRFL
jgi:hypothetical protein